MSMKIEQTNEELALLIQQGHTELYKQLWNQTQRLLKKLALHDYHHMLSLFEAAGVEAEDCCQVAYFALMDAVNCFDEAKGLKLSSYFNYHLKNRLNDMLGKSRGTVPEPLNDCLSIDAPLTNDSDSELTIGSAIVDETAFEAFENADADFDSSTLRSKLDEIMSRELSVDELRVMRLSYWRGFSVKSVSAFLECDAKAIKRKALRKLRKPSVAQEICFFSDAESAFYHSGFSLFKEKQGSIVELAAEW